MTEIIFDEIRSRIALIDQKIKTIEENLKNAEADVERDLESIIEAKFWAIEDRHIIKKLESFKKQNKDLLLRSKVNSLNKAKFELLKLKNDIFSLSSMMKEPAESFC